MTADSRLEAGINSVLEIVIDGLTLEAVQKAMRAGMQAAARPGLKKIAAGNYGGGLGQYQIHLQKTAGVRCLLNCHSPCLLQAGRNDGSVKMVAGRNGVFCLPEAGKLNQLII